MMQVIRLRVSRGVCHIRQWQWQSCLRFRLVALKEICIAFNILFIFYFKIYMRFIIIIV